VAHLDERPANIMWKALINAENEHVELRLIDFEDAVFFDHVISSEYVAAVVRRLDLRYPFKNGDEKSIQFAKKFHNDFFYEALLLQWMASEEADFNEFMNIKGSEILLNLLKSLLYKKNMRILSNVNKVWYVNFFIWNIQS
jgi:hypothetical protein